MLCLANLNFVIKKVTAFQPSLSYMGFVLYFKLYNTLCHHSFGYFVSFSLFAPRAARSFSVLSRDYCCENSRSSS